MMIDTGASKSEMAFKEPEKVGQKLKWKELEKEKTLILKKDKIGHTSKAQYSEESWLSVKFQKERWRTRREF
jgi:hypothetical protein